MITKLCIVTFSNNSNTFSPISTTFSTKNGITFSLHLLVTNTYFFARRVKNRDLARNHSLVTEHTVNDALF